MTRDYTWTVEQINQVGNLYVETHVSESVIRQSFVPPAQIIGPKMFLQLSGEARTFGVELDQRDIRFHTRPLDQAKHVLAIQAAWAPQIREVELVGGWADGQTWGFERAPFEPLVTTGPVESLVYDIELPVTVATKQVVYELSGWREKSRRWTYSPVH